MVVSDITLNELYVIAHALSMLRMTYNNSTYELHQRQRAELDQLITKIDDIKRFEEICAKNGL